MLGDAAPTIGLQDAVAARIVMKIAFSAVAGRDLRRDLVHSGSVHVLALRVRGTRALLDQVPAIVIKIGRRITRWRGHVAFRHQPADPALHTSAQRIVPEKHPVRRKRVARCDPTIRHRHSVPRETRVAHKAKWRKLSLHCFNKFVTARQTAYVNRED